MTKNEIIARWLGHKELTREQKEMPINKYHLPLAHFTLDYRSLHEAWVKFRDLKFDTPRAYLRFIDYRDKVKAKITDGTITEAFDELCKGIEWYELLKK